jgi:PAS domain S-box-containing protein
VSSKGTTRIQELKPEEPAADNAAVQGAAADDPAEEGELTLDPGAVAALQRRYDRLRLLLDHTYQFSSLLTPDGVVIEANRAAVRTADTTAGEVLDKLFWEAPFFHHLSSAQVDAVRNGVARARRGEFVRIQQVFKPPSKSPRHIDLTLQPINDAERRVCWIIAEARDVSDVIATQTALRAVEDRFEIATQSANVGVWELDLPAHTVWYSDTWYRMLGYDPSEFEVHAETWRELVHPDDLSGTLESVRAHAERKQPHFHAIHRMRHKNGSWRWIEVLGRTVLEDADGHPLRIAGVHLDITERKETEGRLALAQRLESVGMLAAGVAHEINTPIQFIGDSVYFAKDAVAELLEASGTLARLARREPLQGELATAVGRIEECLADTAQTLPKAIERALEGVARVTEIVQSMKELAHPDQPKMAWVDINHAIERALVLTRPEYRHLADIETQLATLPPVRCHAGQINQVLLNLLVNAAHAIADAVRGDDRRGRITVSTHLRGSDVIIAIADTGTGIPEHLRHRVFEPFFTTKAVGRGSGQGLAIVHKIVQQHHGTVEFASEAGRGTEFTLQLPIDCAGQ